jgi:pimeloyl-ACP methyl ester carboxylesterase
VAGHRLGERGQDVVADRHRAGDHQQWIGHGRILAEAMPHTESSGARIHWEQQGDGPPLLLVMGFGLSSDAWAPMLPILGAFRTIRYDNRGTGGSGPSGDGYSVEAMAADAAAVLDAAGVERAHVHGVSMGGMIALSLALDHPDRVGGLVLGCTTAAPLRAAGEGGRVAELARATLLMSSDPKAALDLLLPLLLSDAFLAENPAVRELGAMLTATGSRPEDATATMRAIADLGTGRAFDVSDRLHEIRAPTLIQHGTEDRLIPVEEGRRLAAAIPGAEYQELAGAGHAYGIERPVDAYGRLLGFLAAHPLS